MSPLEEIENCIEYVNMGDDHDLRMKLLGPLFQARAMERLCENITRALPPAPNMPHEWARFAHKFMPSVGAEVCELCAERASHPMHSGGGQ